MCRLWVCVFCSVVFHAHIATVGSLGGFFKKGARAPSNETIYNRIKHTFSFKPVHTFKKGVWNPLTDKLGKKITAATVGSNEPVCYEVVGCFPLDSPWKTVLRPLGAPMSPEKIRTSVYFFCRQSSSSEPIYLYPEINLEGISFLPNRTTVVIVHGFSSAGDASWVKKLRDVYLKLKDVNLFCVNWEEGARSLNYLQVASNARVVGRELALLIKKLIQEYEARADDFHLIGHSLGAHVCSYAAKEIPGIGHLTALDPAQPGFEGFGAKVRLDKSDAKFVEVHHTDARPFLPTFGFGMISSSGHIDFYYNGFYQPGCLIPQAKANIQSLGALANIQNLRALLTIQGLGALAKIPVEVLSQLISCAHSKAYEYYTEAIDRSNCTFWGRKITRWYSFENIMSINISFTFTLPNFFKCTTKTCVPLGLNLKDSPLRGAFLVLTRTRPPYCPT